MGYAAVAAPPPFPSPACGGGKGRGSVAERRIMKVLIAGGGIGGLATALMLHARGIDCAMFEQVARSASSASASTPCRTRSRNWRSWACWTGSTGRHPHARTDLCQPLRPGDVARAARHRRRLRHAAILHPPRQAARRAAAGGARAARRTHPPRLPAGIVHRGRRRRHRLALRPQRLAPENRARRRADRRRRHPFHGARKSSIPTRARRSGTASCCGAAPPTGRPFSPAAPW